MQGLINFLGLPFKFSSDERKTEQIFAIADEVLNLTDSIQINVKKALPASPLVRKTICLIARHARRAGFAAVTARPVRIPTVHELLSKLLQKLWPEPLTQLAG